MTNQWCSAARRWVLALALGLSPTAHSAAVFFTSEAAFLAAAGGTLTLENFENFDFATTASITTLPSGLNMAANNFSSFFDLSNGLFFLTQAGGTTVTFTFDSGLPNAFGVILADLADVNNSGTTVTLATSSGASQAFVIPFNSTGDERFFGVIDTVGFVSASITNSSLGDLVVIDDVRWGNVADQGVPEPATLALLGLGLAGLGWSRRKK